MGRYDLTDAQYALLAPELPTNAGKVGAPWGAHRPIINGILWRLHAGTLWRIFPHATAPIKRSTTAIPGGDAMGHGSASRPPSNSSWMRMA
jgi:transposase